MFQREISSPCGYYIILNISFTMNTRLRRLHIEQFNSMGQTNTVFCLMLTVKGTYGKDSEI